MFFLANILGTAELNIVQAMAVRPELKTSLQYKVK
jgi:hypothetical protein